MKSTKDFTHLGTPATTGNIRIASLIQLLIFGIFLRSSCSSSLLCRLPLAIIPSSCSSETIAVSALGFEAIEKSVNASVCAVVSNPPMIIVPISARSCSSDNPPPAHNATVMEVVLKTDLCNAICFWKRPIFAIRQAPTLQIWQLLNA